MNKRTALKQSLKEIAGLWGPIDPELAKPHLGALNSKQRRVLLRLNELDKWSSCAYVAMEWLPGEFGLGHYAQATTTLSILKQLVSRGVVRHERGTAGNGKGAVYGLSPLGAACVALILAGPPDPEDPFRKKRWPGK